MRWLFSGHGQKTAPTFKSGGRRSGRPAAVQLFASVSRLGPEIVQHGVQLPPSVLGAPPPELLGVCPVCNQQAVFTGFTDNLRESGTCSVCQSFNRQRQMACFMRHRLNVAKAPAEHWVFQKPLSIYNTESTGALHRALCELPGYEYSEYFGPAYSPGEIVEGVRHENLQALSFADLKFDLVMSSDVMEHMPNPYQAHREIHRVLKPGGRHIFTVPSNMGASHDDIRAELVDGQVVYHAEQLFHGDPVRPDEGILVWTIFGQEMLLKLKALGFEASAWLLYDPASGIIGDYALIYEARKPQ